ncbi:MAG: hypothetical protein ACYC0F_18095 [Rhodanobacter sp.]
MLNRPYVPEGLTIIFEAPQRRGKTLAGVIYAADALCHGRNVFSNIGLGFRHQPLEFRDIKLADGESKFWNGHIFIDELNFYYDGRRSMKPVNIEFGAFLLQQKKQGCNLTGTTHELESLDIRLRHNYDFLVTPTVFPKYPARPNLLRLVIENGPLQPPSRRTWWVDCSPYLGLYDSFAVYDPFKTPPPAEKRHIESRVNLLEAAQSAA